ncbi:MAG: Flp family type IVb pilin [Hyphomonas sp.]|nr:Flp family type IVb pilin [Hyphomonas sp.]
MIKAFIADDSGATAIEYGLIVALIAIGIIAGLKNTRAALIDLLTVARDGFHS